MAKGIQVWQGTDKIVNIAHDYSDMPDASEIEVFIGKDSQVEITKNLSSGVSGVTADDLVLSIDSADTESLCSGEYEIQARITTAGGSKLFGRILPGFVVVRDSVFTDRE